ncbi:phenylalanine N-monooxygenase CYP79D16-like [Mercurialis annua]|uniref:phenylalanine N-monooxygenase CYP79D16-like n=1 Tax=Mercurialis annua TaxID=3986 RepID=UPI0024ACDFF3|nr:phenylalanine N-monooxygenase CYP79D16-like [Mercurialis annua]
MAYLSTLVPSHVLLAIFRTYISDRGDRLHWVLHTSGLVSFCGSSVIKAFPLMIGFVISRLIFFLNIIDVPQLQLSPFTTSSFMAILLSLNGVILVVNFEGSFILGRGAVSASTNLDAELEGVKSTFAAPSIIDRILPHTVSFMNYIIFTQIFREQNMTADTLSKIGLIVVFECFGLTRFITMLWFLHQIMKFEVSAYVVQKSVSFKTTLLGPDGKQIGSCICKAVEFYKARHSNFYYSENDVYRNLNYFSIIIFSYFMSSRSSKNKNVNRLPPGPKPWPLVGCMPTMLANKQFFRWIHSLMHEMNTEIACIRLGNVHVIPVTSPEISCEFLKSQDAVFANRPLTMSTHLISRGYLTTALVPSGDQWKKMKKVVETQLLSPAKHKWFYEKRLEAADHLLCYVNNQCTKSTEVGGLVNLRLATQHYCGNVTRKILFNRKYFGVGMEDGGPGFEEEEHTNAIFTALTYTYAFSVSDYLPCLIGLDLDGHEKIIQNAIGIINKYHDPVIDERVRQWRDGVKNQEDDLLDLLITLKDANGNSVLSIQEIKAQIIEILMAAIDNPSNAVEWAIAEMINQPKILEKAVEELDRVVGKDRLVQESDFSHLNYIKACAKEAFRLHPIVPFNLPHVSVSDTTVSGYFIPKGSHVLLSRLGLGRNPRIWDEPHLFKPERHINNDHGSKVVLTETNLRYVSFSTGKRGCPAITMGTSMTVMLFARLLQGFSWSAPPNQTRVDLTESKNSLALAKPLIALAKPRLPAHLYPA